MAEDAWHWLRQNEPESYQQLLDKLDQAARRDLSPSGKVELFQLVKVFKWCAEHGVPLNELDVKDHLHKYREAVSYLRRFTRSAKPGEAEIDTVRQIIARIKQDASRQETRLWARGRRGEEPVGHQFDWQTVKGKQCKLADGRTGLIILGPGLTVRRIKSIVEQFVSWDLEVDEALLAEIGRSCSGVTGVRNYLPISDNLGTAGQPNPEQFGDIRAAGYQVVINLAMPDSTDALPNEGDLVAKHDMTYVHIPVVWKAPTYHDLERFFEAIDEHQGRKIFVHCVVNERVSVFVFLYRVIRQGIPLEEARGALLRIWEPDETWQRFIDDALGRHGIKP